jgi:hypothetical protein
LDREAGPKAGNLISFLDREFVIKRCREVTLDQEKFWREASLTAAALDQWLAKEGTNVVSVSSQILSGTTISVAEFTATLVDGKKHLLRVLIEAVGDAALAGAQTAAARISHATGKPVIV